MVTTTKTPGNNSNNIHEKTIDITKDNFIIKSNELIDYLKTASFVSIHSEITGFSQEEDSSSTDSNKDDTPYERYKNSFKDIAEKYSIIQFGIALFHTVNSNNNNNDKETQFIVRTYNFYLFPSTGGALASKDDLPNHNININTSGNKSQQQQQTQQQREIIINPQVIQNNNTRRGSSKKKNSKSKTIDYNKWINNGIPYVTTEVANKKIKSLIIDLYQQNNSMNGCGSYNPDNDVVPSIYSKKNSSGGLFSMNMNPLSLFFPSSLSGGGAAGGGGYFGAATNRSIRNLNRLNRNLMNNRSTNRDQQQQQHYQFLQQQILLARNRHHQTHRNNRNNNAGNSNQSYYNRSRQYNLSRPEDINFHARTMASLREWIDSAIITGTNATNATAPLTRGRGQRNLFAARDNNNANNQRQRRAQRRNNQNHRAAVHDARAAVAQNARANAFARRLNPNPNVAINNANNNNNNNNGPPPLQRQQSLQDRIQQRNQQRLQQQQQRPRQPDQPLQPLAANGGGGGGGGGGNDPMDDDDDDSSENDEEDQIEEGISFFLPPCNSFLRKALCETISIEYPTLLIETSPCGGAGKQQIKVLRLTPSEKIARKKRLSQNIYNKCIKEEIGFYKIFVALSYANRGILNNRNNNENEHQQPMSVTNDHENNIETDFLTDSCKNNILLTNDINNINLNTAYEYHCGNHYNNNNVIGNADGTSTPFVTDEDDGNGGVVPHDDEHDEDRDEHDDEGEHHNNNDDEEEAGEEEEKKQGGDNHQDEDNQSDTYNTPNNRKIPIIVHNGFLDILMLLTHCYSNNLPDNYNMTKQLINNMFPLLYDTKVLSFENLSSVGGVIIGGTDPNNNINHTNNSYFTTSPLLTIPTLYNDLILGKRGGGRVVVNGTNNHNNNNVHLFKFATNEQQEDQKQQGQQEDHDSNNKKAAVVKAIVKLSSNNLKRHDDSYNNNDNDDPSHLQEQRLESSLRQKQEQRQRRQQQHNVHGDASYCAYMKGAIYVALCKGIINKHYKTIIQNSKNLTNNTSTTKKTPRKSKKKKKNDEENDDNISATVVNNNTVASPAAAASASPTAGAVHHNDSGNGVVEVHDTTTSTSFLGDIVINGDTGDIEIHNSNATASTPNNSSNEVKQIDLGQLIHKLTSDTESKLVKKLFGRNKLFVKNTLYTIDLESMPTTTRAAVSAAKQGKEEKSNNTGITSNTTIALLNDPMIRGMSPTYTFRITGIDPSSITNRDITRCINNAVANNAAAATSNNRRTANNNMTVGFGGVIAAAEARARANNGLVGNRNTNNTNASSSSSMNINNKTSYEIVWVDETTFMVAARYDDSDDDDNVVINNDDNDNQEDRKLGAEEAVEDKDTTTIKDIHPRLKEYGDLVYNALKKRFHAESTIYTLDEHLQQLEKKIIKDIQKSLSHQKRELLKQNNLFYRNGLSLSSYVFEQTSQYISQWILGMFGIWIPTTVNDRKRKYADYITNLSSTASATVAAAAQLDNNNELLLGRRPMKRRRRFF